MSSFSGSGVLSPSPFRPTLFGEREPSTAEAPAVIWNPTKAPYLEPYLYTG